MDVMMRLPSSSLDVLRSKFMSSAGGDGLILEEFVDAMLHYLPRADSEEECIKLVMELVDLYHQVDVNGDCFMSWDEFTSHCIEAGMLATRIVEKPLAVNFRVNPDFKDPLAHHVVQEIHLIESLKAVLVVESGSSAVKVLDATTLKLQRVLQVRREASNGEMENHRFPIVNITYVHDLQLLAICSADMSISFWTWDDFRPLGHIQSRSIRKMTYASNATLYTTDDSGLVCMWALRIKHFHGGPAQCICVPQGTLEGHTSIVCAFAEIPRYGLFITGGMDARILLWDMETNRRKGDLLKHKRAVCHLVYAKSMDLLLSAGYEHEIYCWDVYNKQIVLELTGHHHPCVGVQLTYLHAEDTQEHAVTCDAGGVMKLWNLGRTASGEASARQTFTADPYNGLYKPRMILSCGPRRVLTVSRELRLLEAVSTYVQDFLPFKALFNSVLDRFYVAIGKYIQVWCAITGDMLDEWYHVSESEISCMCFDDRERKVVFGNVSGHVVVLNAINGAIMKNAHLADIQPSANLLGHVTPSKDAAHPRALPSSVVLNIHYNREDKCLIVITTRSVFVFDDDGTEENVDGVLLPLFRVAFDVHEYPITASAFSHELSLVATGSADKSIRIWEFQQLRLEGECIGHTGQVTAMAFVESYPLLVSTDEDANLSIWTVRPSPRPYVRLVSAICKSPRERAPEGRPVLLPDDGLEEVKSPEDTSNAQEQSATRRRTRTRNDGGEEAAKLSAMKTPEGSFRSRSRRATIGSSKNLRIVYPLDKDEEPVPVRCLEIERSENGLLLYTGDQRGDVKEWNLELCIKDLEIDPVDPEKLPPNLDGYNASRHVEHSYRYLFEDAGHGFDEAEEDGGAQGPEVEETRRKRMQEHKERKRRQERMRQKLLRIRQNYNASATKAKKARLPVLKLFAAHGEDLNSVQIINTPASILTSSTDGNVRIWNREGRRIGNLTMGETEVANIQKGFVTNVSYNFNLDVQAKLWKRYDEAVRILESVRKQYALPRLLNRQTLCVPPAPQLDISLDMRAEKFTVEIVRLGNTRVAKALAHLLFHSEHRHAGAEEDSPSHGEGKGEIGAKGDHGGEAGSPGSQTTGRSVLAAGKAKSKTSLPVLDAGVAAAYNESDREERFSPLRNSYKSYAFERQRKRGPQDIQARLRETKVDTTPSELLRSLLQEEEEKAAERKLARKRAKRRSTASEYPAVRDIDHFDEDDLGQNADADRDAATGPHASAGLVRRAVSLPALSAARSHALREMSMETRPAAGTSRPHRRISVMDRGPRKLSESSDRRSETCRRSTVFLEDMQKALDQVVAENDAPDEASSTSGSSSSGSRRGSLENSSNDGTSVAEANSFDESCISRHMSRIDEPLPLSQAALEEAEPCLEAEAGPVPEYRRRSMARVSYVMQQPAPGQDPEDGFAEALTSPGSPCKKKPSGEMSRRSSRLFTSARKGDSRVSVMSAATQKSIQRRRQSNNTLLSNPLLPSSSNPNIGIFSKREILSLKILFDQVGGADDGTVELEELMDNVDKLNMDIEQLTSMFESLDTDHSGTLTFVEMLRMFFAGASLDDLRAMEAFIEATYNAPEEKVQIAMTEADREELSELFRLYDKDRGGTLSLIELFEVLNNRDYKPRDQFGNDEDLLFSFADLERLTQKFNFTLEHELSEDEFVELMFDFQHTEVDL